MTALIQDARREAGTYCFFTIILAAAEAAVALAIVLNVFHLFDSIRPSDADLLRE